MARTIAILDPVCENCAGTGVVFNAPCPNCKGGGRVPMDDNANIAEWARWIREQPGTIESVEVIRRLLRLQKAPEGLMPPDSE